MNCLFAKFGGWFLSPPKSPDQAPESGFCAGPVLFFSGEEMEEWKTKVTKVPWKLSFSSLTQPVKLHEPCNTIYSMASLLNQPH